MQQKESFCVWCLNVHPVKAHPVSSSYIYLIRSRVAGPQCWSLRAILFRFVPAPWSLTSLILSTGKNRQSVHAEREWHLSSVHLALYNTTATDFPLATPGFHSLRPQVTRLDTQAGHQLQLATHGSCVHTKLTTD